MKLTDCLISPHINTDDDFAAVSALYPPYSTAAAAGGKQVLESRVLADMVSSGAWLVPF